MVYVFVSHQDLRKNKRIGTRRKWRGGCRALFLPFWWGQHSAATDPQIHLRVGRCCALFKSPVQGRKSETWKMCVTAEAFRATVNIGPSHCALSIND